MHTKQKIFATLSGEDISKYVKHLEAKDGTSLPYLPWQYAHQVMMKHFPEYEWSFAESADGLEVFYFKDGTAEVRVVMTIGEVTMIASKSVTNRSNEAYPNPNADDIHNAKMRCRVRAMAELGLGWDLWTSPEKYAKPTPVADALAAALPTPERDDESVASNLFAAVVQADTLTKAKQIKKKVEAAFKNRKLPAEELEILWSELKQERGWT
jgi:hypothetical protein